MKRNVWKCWPAIVILALLLIGCDENLLEESSVSGGSESVAADETESNVETESETENPPCVTGHSWGELLSNDVVHWRCCSVCGVTTDAVVHDIKMESDADGH
jgi:hypothetical protein